MAIAPDDHDMIVRTVLGEAGDDGDHAKVARDILDKHASGKFGASPTDVVLSRGAFPSWAKKARELISIDPTSERYKKVAEVVNNVASDASPKLGSVLRQFGFGTDGLPIGEAKTPEPGSVLKLFGHDVSDVGKMAPAKEAPGQVTRPRPEIREAAKELSASRGIIQPFVEGMPIVGPGIEMASSAGAAALQPIFRDTGNTSFGERYQENQDVTHAANALYEQANPTKSLAANLAGGAAVTGPFAGTTVGGMALGLRAPTLGGRFYSGMMGGTAINALDAAMRGQDVQQGGTIGAITGAGGPLIGEGVRSGVNMLARSTPALRGYNSVARGALTNALEGETPQSIAEGMRRMGPAGMLADVNTGLTDIAGGIADSPGPGKQVVREAFRQRAADAAHRIDTAVTRAMGPAANIVESKQFLTEARKAAADPLYHQWRSMQVHPTQEIKDLIPRLEKAGAFDQAEKISGITGEPINRNFFTPGQTKEFPTTQTWDYVKRGLDSKIDQAYAGGDKTLARHLIDLRSNLVSEIDKTNAGSVWRQARQEFADRSALIDQIDRGRDTFLGSRSGLSADELRDEIRGLSGPELQARIQGARSAINEAMGDSLRGQTTMRDKLLASNNREKLRLLLGNDRADILVHDLESERFLSAQDQNVRGGSQTTPKKERVNALAPSLLADWNPDFMRPLSWIPPHIMEQLRPTTMIEGARAQRHANALQQLSEAVTTNRPQDIRDLIRAISDEQARGAATNASAGRYGSRAATLPIAASSVLRLRRDRDNSLRTPDLISSAR
jgi:hypothetical protein